MTAVTYDEQQLIAIHNAGTITDTISALKEMREYISEEETELKAITDSAISRLEEMTDEEYAQLDLIPDFID
ncbi:MAG: transposon-transfer assisting family protein [Clostridia bacterium]|nr:transposon-transfer assisting family protein [Clostridia bacterium]